MSKLQLFPYLPNRPEWATLKPAFDAAKIQRPGIKLAFVGHDGRNFYFQEWGNSTPVIVPMKGN